MMAAIGTTAATYAGQAAGAQIYAMASAQVASVVSSALPVATFVCSAAAPAASAVVAYGSKIAGMYIVTRPLSWMCEDATRLVAQKCLDPDSLICTMSKATELTACASNWVGGTSMLSDVASYAYVLRVWA